MAFHLRDLSSHDLRELVYGFSLSDVEDDFEEDKSSTSHS